MKIRPVTYRLIKYLTLVICLISISSCVNEYEDLSDDAEFENIVGQYFIVKEDLWAIAITLDQNYKKQVDYVTLVGGVGFSGPEVIFKKRFDKGIVIRVERVLVSKSRISYFSSVRYIVKNVSNEWLNEYELSVDASGTTDEPNYGLNPVYFEHINNWDTSVLGTE